MKVTIEIDDTTVPLHLHITFDTHEELNALFAIGMADCSVPQVTAKIYGHITTEEDVADFCKRIAPVLRPYAWDKTK